MVLLAIAAVVLALSAFAELSQASLLTALRDGTRTITPAEAKASDDRVAAFGAIGQLVVLAAAACMITWLWQSVRFDQVVLRRSSRFSRGWAIGAWFVPFLNLVRPKQIVDDVWNSATEVANGGGARSRALLHAWWALYLGGGFFQTMAIFSTRGSTGATDTDSLLQASRMSALGYGLTAVAGVLAVVWLRQLRQAQAAADGIAMDAARQHWAAYGVMPGAPVGAQGQWTVPPYGQAPYGQAPYGQAPYGQAGPYGPPAAPRPAQWPPPPVPQGPPRRAEWPPPATPPATPGPPPSAAPHATQPTAPTPAEWPTPVQPPAPPRPAQWPPPPPDEDPSSQDAAAEAERPDAGGSTTDNRPPNV
jgi:hypothetical protein